MDRKGRVDLNSEAADVEESMGFTSGSKQTLYRPVATQRGWGEKSSAPLAFLDKPAAAPPTEPDEPLPSLPNFPRLYESRAEEHRVDESVARVPKWMRRPSDRGGGSRPVFDLEASPSEDTDRGASKALSGFAQFQSDSEIAPQEKPAEWGARESGGVEKLEGSLSKWLTPPGRPKSAPLGRSGTGIGGTSLASGKEGVAGARASLASAVDSRLERQRALVDARRQKIESRKERLNQQRAQELEARRARQEALQAGGSRAEPEAPPLGKQRTEPVSTLLSKPNPSREDLRTSLSAPLAKPPADTVTEEQELLRAAEEGLAKLRRLQGFQGFDRRVEAPQWGVSRSLESGGGASAKEEETSATVKPKLALERLLELQKGGLDPVDVAGQVEVQPGPERRAPGSPRDLWTGAAHGGRKSVKDSARLGGEALPSLFPGSSDRKALETTFGGLTAGRVGGAPALPVDGGGLDLSLHLGLPSPGRNLPPASPPKSPPPVSKSSDKKLTPDDIEVAIREYVQRSQLSALRHSDPALRQSAQEERGKGRASGATHDGGSSTNVAPGHSPRAQREFPPHPSSVVELLRRSPEVKRKREEAFDVERSGSEGARAASPGHSGRRWLSAAAAEIEDSVLAELHRGGSYRDGRRRGPSDEASEKRGQQ